MDTILQTCFLTADLPEKIFCLWRSVHYITVYVCNKMQVSSLNGTWSSNDGLFFKLCLLVENVLFHPRLVCIDWRY